MESELLQKKIDFIKSLGQRIKLFFRSEYFANRFVIWLLLSGLSINLANWLLIFFMLRPVSSSIILHYNVYFGVDMTGDPHQAYFLPITGLILFLLDFLLSIYFYAKKERIITHILLMAGLMIQLSVLISITSIILINY